MSNVVPLRRHPAVEPTPERPSAELVRAMAGGDRAALGALFDRYHRELYGFLHAALGVAGNDLDDLIQDTFLAAHGAAGRFEGRAQVKTWLFGVALNVARNHLRAERRRRRATATFEPAATAAEPPDARADSASQLGRVAAAIAALPTDLRLAYVTCVIEGVEGDEAARVLGARKGTIWRRVHEAREALRLAIGRSASEP